MDKPKFDTGPIKRLLTPRKLAFLVTIGTANYLWAIGKVDFLQAALIMVGFYFGNKAALDKPGQDS